MLLIKANEGDDIYDSSFVTFRLLCKHVGKALAEYVLAPLAINVGHTRAQNCLGTQKTSLKKLAICTTYSSVSHLSKLVRNPFADLQPPRITLPSNHVAGLRPT